MFPFIKRTFHDSGSFQGHSIVGWTRLNISYNSMKLNIRGNSAGDVDFLSKEQFFGNFLY